MAADYNSGRGLPHVRASVFQVPVPGRGLLRPRVPPHPMEQLPEEGLAPSPTPPARAQGGFGVA